MNIEQFVQLVQTHKVLWDPSDSNYHSRDHIRKSWSRISEEMQIPEDELRKKWRGLRDTYVKEIKKATKRQSPKGSDTTELYSKWCYFKMLQFLKDTIGRRDLKRNTLETSEAMDSNGDCVTNTDSDYPPSPYTSQDPLDSFEETSTKVFEPLLESKIEYNDENNASYTNQDSLDNYDPTTAFESPPLKRKATYSEENIPSYTTSQNSLETTYEKISTKTFEPPTKSKVKCNEDNTNDADAQFLMSLLPFLQEVSHNRKLIVRAKLQQVFIDEQQTHTTPVMFAYSNDS